MDYADAFAGLPPGTLTPRRVVMLGYPDAQVLDVTGPLSVFHTAACILAANHGRTAHRAAPAAYQTVLVSPDGAPFTSSCGVRLVPDAAMHAAGKADTVLVAGGPGMERAARDPRVLQWIASRPREVRRLASVCTGAFLLAASGVLDDRRVTTHWRYCERLAAEYPRVTVEPDAIHVRDDAIYSSAGVTAGMDLALAMVEEDHSRALALAVARDKVMHLKRPGGQSQYSVALAAQSSGDGPIGTVVEWISGNPAEPLSVPAMAERAAMSPRTFARQFRSRTGQTPARFVESARLELCRRRLEESAASVDAIASQCGFGNTERMRKAFLRRFRVTPQDYRRRFRTAGH